MIMDDCQKVLGLLNSVQETGQNQGLCENLTNRVDDLKPVAAHFMTSSEVLFLLREKGAVPDSTQFPDADQPMQRAVDMQETLQANPEDVTRGHNFTSLKKSFDKLAEQIDEVIKESWSVYRDRQHPKIDRSQLKQAELLMGETAREFESLDKEARALTRSAPRDEESLNEIEGLWKQLRELIRQFPALAEDPEVQKFLEAADSPDGAQLLLLTPTVVDWLKEREMFERFCVVRA
jgi:hypothetical protein